MGRVTDMNTLPFNKELLGRSNYSISLHISSKEKISIMIYNVIKLENSGNIRTNCAEILNPQTPSQKLIIWESENYFDTKIIENFSEFALIMKQKLNEDIDWITVMEKFKKELDKFISYKVLADRTITDALLLASDDRYIESIKGIKFGINNRIYAAHLSSTLAVFVYKPENRVYAFKGNPTLDEIQKEICSELIKNHSDKTWCTCENKNDTNFVQNYQGVSHGWICTRCKRFVQMG